VNLVVRAAGLAYERIGNSILVAEANSLKSETGLSSYVVELKYADAKDVQAAITVDTADLVRVPEARVARAATSQATDPEAESLKLSGEDREGSAVRLRLERGGLLAGEAIEQRRHLLLSRLEPREHAARGAPVWAQSLVSTW